MVDGHNPKTPLPIKWVTTKPLINACHVGWWYKHEVWWWPTLSSLKKKKKRQNQIKIKFQLVIISWVPPTLTYAHREDIKE